MRLWSPHLVTVKLIISALQDKGVVCDLRVNIFAISLEAIHLIADLDSLPVTHLQVTLADESTRTVCVDTVPPHFLETAVVLPELRDLRITSSCEKAGYMPHLSRLCDIGAPVLARLSLYLHDTMLEAVWQDVARLVEAGRFPELATLGCEVVSSDSKYTSIIKAACAASATSTA